MTDVERVQYKLMLPAPLKAALEEAAHEHRRSLSAEIIQRLYLTLDFDAYIGSEAADPDESPREQYERESRRTGRHIDEAAKLFLRMQETGRRLPPSDESVNEPSLSPELFDKLFSRLDRIEKKLDEK